jgi:preprotein translocase subunit YajC
MRNNLQIGNKIVTTGGVFGTIMEIDSEKSVVSVNIAPNVNQAVPLGGLFSGQ